MPLFCLPKNDNCENNSKSYLLTQYLFTCYSLLVKIYSSIHQHFVMPLSGLINIVICATWLSQCKHFTHICESNLLSTRVRYCQIAYIHQHNVRNFYLNNVSTASLRNWKDVGTGSFFSCCLLPLMNILCVEHTE